MIKKLFAIFFAVSGIVNTTMAQSLSPWVIATAGTSIKNANVQMAYTIGELIVPTIKGDSNYLTQGFNQPDKLILSSVQNFDRTSFSVSAYPNPTNDLIHLDIQTSSRSANFEIEIFDINGQKLAPELI